MSSIAAAKGISQDTLMATVTRAVAAAVPQGLQPLGGDVLQTVSQRIAAATTVPAGFSVTPPR
jgi:hypothetical protein